MLLIMGGFIKCGLPTVMGKAETGGQATGKEESGEAGSLTPATFLSLCHLPHAAALAPALAWCMKVVVAPPLALVLALALAAAPAPIWGTWWLWLQPWAQITAEDGATATACSKPVFKSKTRLLPHSLPLLNGGGGGGTPY